MTSRVRWIVFFLIVAGIFVGGIGLTLFKGQSINWPWLMANTALVAAGFYYLLIFRKTKKQEKIYVPKEKKAKNKRR